MYARQNDKVSYNIKLDKKFLGRKNIRLRPDASDNSHLRSKLCCDIANRMGVPSIQATYARLYMNNEYWGLYVLMDAIKPSWIKQTFNPSEKEITTLYQCKSGGMNLKSGSAKKCVNANDDIPDMTALNDFVKEVNNCKTAEELEKIMDVDVFLKFMAMEWLIGSFDHFLIYGHNFYFYKRETDGKWLIIEHDYDNTFGTGVKTSLWASKGPNQDGSSNTKNTTAANPNPIGGWGWNWGGNNNSYRGNEPIKYSFADWEMNIPVINVLVHKNKAKFESIVREVLVSAFNPTLLEQHISELKEFLIPYIEEDSTKGPDGRLPGRINKKGKQRTSSVKEFEENIENSVKMWIQTKFEVACNNYGFNQTEILNEAATYVPVPFDYASYGLGKQKKDEEEEKKKQEEEEKKKQEEEEKKKQEEEEKKKQEEEEKKKQEEEDKKNQEQECWSDILGYSCCKKTCNIVYVDNSGNWGVEDDQWCGIIDSECEAIQNEAQCYGELSGEYKCCESCDVWYTDKHGDWGVENNDWCSTKYSCTKQ